MRRIRQAARLSFLILLTAGMAGCTADPASVQTAAQQAATFAGDLLRQVVIVFLL